MWVKFQLQTLREKKSDFLILTALKSLPRDLPETFERILSKYTEAEDIDIGRQIFRWVAVAKRPLTVEELREAIGTEPLQEVWSNSMCINNMKRALGCCGNLVYIEEEQQTLHFTHSSVKQYLLSKAVQRPLSKYYIDLQKADAEAGTICITYLNFAVFDKQVAQTGGKIISVTGIPSTVVKNSLPLGRSANKIALHLLRQTNKPSKSIQRRLEEAVGDTEAERLRNAFKYYTFRDYAQRFWLDHSKQNVDPSSPKLWGLWCRLIREADRRETLSSVPWTLEDLKGCAINVVQWIVEYNHCSLAQLIIDSDVQITQQNLLNLIRGAAIRGHSKLVEIGLGSTDISQFILNSGVQSAAEGGHLNVVDRLLQEKADVNAAAAYDGRTALQAAAEGGHLNVVE